MAKKQMHLAQFLVHGPTYHSQAMWRHPETAARNYDWTQPELYQHIAQVCERGNFGLEDYVIEISPELSANIVQKVVGLHGNLAIEKEMLGSRLPALRARAKRTFELMQPFLRM